MTTDICPECGETLEIGDYPFCPHGRTVRSAHSVHPRERSVVYRNPETGKICYPGRNDALKTGDRYEKMGFVRTEMTSLRDLDNFCKETGLRNDVADYDPSNRD